MKKIVTILGAPPQFVKASVVSHTIARTDNLSEVIVHTGQYYDANMSDVFFTELDISHPHYTLSINNYHHAEMTGRISWA